MGRRPPRIAALAPRAYLHRGAAPGRRDAPRPRAASVRHGRGARPPPAAPPRRHARVRRRRWACGLRENVAPVGPGARAARVRAGVRRQGVEEEVVGAQGDGLGPHARVRLGRSEERGEAAARPATDAWAAEAPGRHGEGRLPLADVRAGRGGAGGPIPPARSHPRSFAVGRPPSRALRLPRFPRPPSADTVFATFSSTARARPCPPRAGPDWRGTESNQKDVERPQPRAPGRHLERRSRRHLARTMGPTPRESPSLPLSPQLRGDRPGAPRP